MYGGSVMEDDEGDGLFLKIKVKKKCHKCYLLLPVTRKVGMF